MKRNRNRIYIEKLVSDKNRQIDKRQNNLETVSEHTREISKLLKAKTIVEKVDKGEHISDEERNKLQDVKKQYAAFFEEEEESGTDNGGLEDAISSNVEDKNSYIKKTFFWEII